MKRYGELITVSGLDLRMRKRGRKGGSLNFAIYFVPEKTWTAPLVALMKNR